MTQDQIPSVTPPEHDAGQPYPAPSFTPGPWAYRPRVMDDWGWVRAIDGTTIGHAHSPLEDGEADRHRAAKTDPWEANARLIAASPDYDAAAREFVAPYAELSDEFLREIAASNPGDAHFVAGRLALTAHTAAAVLAFRAALAKASPANVSSARATGVVTDDP